MGLRLKNRWQSIPNGFQYKQRETGWELTTWDFNMLCQEIQKHRRANPQHRLPLDLVSIENEVEFANASRVARIPGADIYLQQGDLPPPKTPPPPGLIQRGLRLAAGGRTLVEWLKSREDAVPPELANTRAAICAKCPKNEPGDWAARFTEPVSAAIRKELEKRRGWELKTDHDEELRVCSACLCPLPLKVHVPIDFILKRIPEDSKAALVPECWILKEGK